MKDKLVKTGHKKAYYRFRFLAFSLLTLTALSFGASLPVVLTYQASVSATLAANQNEEVEDSTEQAEAVYTVEIE